jgi:hypothetical protein
MKHGPEIYWNGMALAVPMLRRRMSIALDTGVAEPICGPGMVCTDILATVSQQFMHDNLESAPWREHAIANSCGAKCDAEPTL